MAKQQQPKASWLDRRREAKRVKKEKRAQRVADQRRYEGEGAEHGTRGWTGSGPS
jgi:hypothetical protein